MTAWLFLNSIFIVGLLIVQYLTLRQVGAMLVRLGPIGARSDESAGPRRGECLATQLEAIRGQLAPSPTDVLLLFGTASCSICQEVLGSAEHLAAYWARTVHLVYIYDEVATTLPATPTSRLVVIFDGWRLRESLGIDSVPFGVRVDGQDRVLGKGLVNAASHIESLLELTSAPADVGEWPAGGIASVGPDQLAR